MNFIFNRLLFFFVEIFSIKIFWAKIFRQIFFGNFFQQTLASRNFQPAKFSAIKIFRQKNFGKILSASYSRRSILLRSILASVDHSESVEPCQAQHSPRVYARALRALRIRARKEFFGRNLLTRAPPHPLFSIRFIKLLNFFLSPYIYTYLLHICVLSFLFFQIYNIFNNLIKK